MASYPNSVASLRSVANKSGVTYDETKTKILFAEDINALIAEVTAIENELGTLPKGSKADVKTRLNDVDTLLNEHSARHENGGADEISVAGLSGVLADNQPADVLTLDPTPNSDHTANGTKAQFTAGAALAFGDVCYMGSDGKMEKGDADAVASAFCFAIVIDANISENAAGNFALPGSFVRDDSWNFATLGQPVYLDTATAGALTQTAPSATDDVIQIIGIAITADIIYFYPQLVQVEHT